MVPTVDKRDCPQTAGHRTPLVLQTVYVGMGLGRAGAPWTPTRCVEIQDARCAKRAEGAVRCVACMWSFRSRTRRWSRFLDARSPRMKANSWTPSTERSDLAKAVNGHIVSARLCLNAVQDDCSRRFRLARRPPARGRRTGPRDCAVDHAVRRPVSVQGPRARRPKIRLHDHRFAGRACAGGRQHQACQGSRHASGLHRHVRTGAPSVDANAAHPPPPVLGRANLGRAQNGAFFVHSRDVKNVARAMHRICRRHELVEPSDDQNRRSAR
ncbi:MAG: hypothetical protein JWN97_1309 [Nocardioides sp.]|nr:hypothetical protein [Nocardioides sp.]